jgi:hypothetical protein
MLMAMRVLLATAVALLVLNFADEHFYGGVFTDRRLMAEPAALPTASPFSNLR